MQKKKVVNYRFLFYPFIIFLLGISVARWLYSGSIEIIITTCLLLSALIFGLCIAKKYKLLITLIAFFFIGNGFFYIGNVSYGIKNYEGQVSVVGRVSDDIVENNYYYNVVLDNIKINGENAKNINLHLTTDGTKNIEVGDILSFECELEEINLFTLKSFNSNYYRDNIGYTASVNLKNVVITDGWTYIDENVRMNIKEQLYSNLSEDNAAICYAVLFGDKSGIDEQIENAYRNSGIIHILTVSGLHVGFLIALVYGFLKICRANKYLNFVLTTCFIFIYAFLCGFAPSVLRAGIMAIVMMLARLSGKRYDSLNSLALAGFIICIFSPLTALDVGFLMSIFCVIGIALLYPFFNRFFTKFFPKWASQYISLSLSAQLAILPFLAMFGSVYNLLSFAINLIIVPFFGILYPYLFVTSIFVALIPALGFILIPCEWGFLLINKLASLFASTSLQFTLSAFDFAVIVFIFILMFVISQYFMEKSVNKFLVSSLVILCISCAFGFTNLPISQKSNIVYLNSYQTECIILTDTNNQKFLIGDNYILKRYANNYKIKDIDYYLTTEDLTYQKVEELEDFNIKEYYCLNGDNSIEEVKEIETNKEIRVGEFAFEVIENSEKIMGIIVQFDSLTIFIAKQTNLNYNTYYQELFLEISPDLVFAGENQNIGYGYTVVSSKQTQNSTYSYESDGNICLYYDSNWTTRRLD